MLEIRAVLDDRFRVPKEFVDMAVTRDLFIRQSFIERTCQTAGMDGTVCPERRFRPSQVCESCPAYLGTFRFFTVTKNRKTGTRWVGMSPGRMDLVKRCIKGDVSRILDRRIRRGMDSEIILKHDLLRPEQDPAVSELLRHERGILVAPPRTGKTVMMVAACVKAGLKTLILTHQEDLLDQFMRTFRQFTNLGDLENDGSRPVILARTRQEILEGNADVILATYQKFLSLRGKDDLDALAERFGCVIVDEVHRGNAHGYASVLSRLRPSRFYGCTGTVERKDGLEYIVDYIIGPVVVRVDAEEMVPRVTVHKSAMKRKPRATQWTAIIRGLCRDEDRNMQLVRNIVRDVKAGHSVLVPVTFRWYAEALVEEINRNWMETSEAQYPIAECFYRYPSEEMKTAVLDRARSGETRVIVAIRQMLLGINCPPWSMLYEIVPANNRPVMEQESKRICTPHPGKKHPRIRLIVDAPSRPSVACAMATLNHFRSFGYHIHPSSWKIMKKCDSAGKGMAEQPFLPSLTPMEKSPELVD